MANVNSSYIPYAYGASYAWNSDTEDDLILDYMNKVFNVEGLASFLMKLGKYSLIEKKKTDNATKLFKLLYIQQTDHINLGVNYSDPTFILKDKEYLSLEIYKEYVAFFKELFLEYNKLDHNNIPLVVDKEIKYMLEIFLGASKLGVLLTDLRNHDKEKFLEVLNHLINARELFEEVWFIRNKESDFEVDEKLKAVTLTEAGINKIEEILGEGDIYNERGIKYLHFLEQALKANVLFHKDKDYVVRDGEIVIVDPFTGRLMPGRRWSSGLHQAIEAKEGVRVNPESLTLASITFQNYFRMYDKLAGMTGTAVTSAEEFDKVYKLDVVIVPTNKKTIREDLSDKIYKTEKAKFEEVVKKIREKHELGQPVLVGTTSIDKK